eukprot:6333939-Ditylum_brightwellii.AAC.1
MYSSKIEAIMDVDNDSVKEVLVATVSDSCANIQPIKTSVRDLVSDFTEVKDDAADCNVPDGAGSTYIIRLPISNPIVAEHGIKLGKISNSDCSNTMESYHPAVRLWAAAIKFQTPGKNSVSKVKMNDAAYAPANDKAIPIIKSAGIVLEFITSDNEEDEPFLKALQICLDNLRANNKKDFYITNPDQDPNATLFKQQQELIKAQAAAAAATAATVSSPLPPMHSIGGTSLHDDDPDSITTGSELSKVKACHSILGNMPVKCLASPSGVTV